MGGRKGVCVLGPADEGLPPGGQDTEPCASASLPVFYLRSRVMESLAVTHVLTYAQSREELHSCHLCQARRSE